MQKVVQREDSVKSVMVDILQYYMGSKPEKKKSKRGLDEVAATPTTPKRQDEVKFASNSA